MRQKQMVSKVLHSAKVNKDANDHHNIVAGDNHATTSGANIITPFNLASELPNSKQHTTANRKTSNQA